MIYIHTFYFNPFRECTYIVTANEQDEHPQPCLIIDPGCYDEKEEKRLLEYLMAHHLTPEAVLITHAHPDHVCGLEFIQKCIPNIKVIGYGAQVTYDEKWGYKILYTPGHKEDCVCYYFEKEGLLFSGDTLFQEGIGRTDLPGGDMQELLRSLAILKQLPKQTVVYPGHGYTTTIEHEIQFNPYL